MDFAHLWQFYSPSPSRLAPWPCSWQAPAPGRPWTQESGPALRQQRHLVFKNNSRQWVPSTEGATWPLSLIAKTARSASEGGGQPLTCNGVVVWASLKPWEDCLVDQAFEVVECLLTGFWINTANPWKPVCIDQSTEEFTFGSAHAKRH